MRLFGILFLIVIAVPVAAQAHPHEWIDVRSTPVFDANKNLTAIREHWLFDIYYTALSIPDFDANKNKKLDPDELMTLALENLHNLKDFSYFTFIEENGKAVGFKGVSGIATQLEQGRVGLNFTVTLDHPIAPAAAKVSYRIYDPSYYVAMLHEKTSPVQLEGVVPGACKFDLTRPEPNAVWTNLAKALDKNATAPDDLGRYFAERVTLTCP